MYVLNFASSVDLNPSIDLNQWVDQRDMNQKPKVSRFVFCGSQM